jgi:hypothetical protein
VTNGNGITVEKQKNKIEKEEDWGEVISFNASRLLVKTVGCKYERNGRNDSSVGIAYGMSAEVRFPVIVRDFRLLHSVQTGSVAHPASYPVGAGVKLAGREADHSPQFSVAVKNCGAILLLMLNEMQGLLYPTLLNI